MTADLALARARTYGLLAEVLLDGWTPRALDVVRGLPWASDLPDDPEQLAVRHQQVFGTAVPPYASVFLSAEGLLGGDVTDGVRQTYARIGFPAGRSDVEPDHAGVLCAAMAFLCGAEADAQRDGQPVDGLQARQRELLAAHLAPWADLLETAVGRQGVAEATELVGLLADLVYSQVDRPRAPAAPPDLLDDARAGLKAVSAFLLVPARSGVWLSLHDIQRIAANAGLSCGFGRRVQMMESLWFSAVDHGRIPELVAAFREELAHWGETPRTAGTVALLGRLHSAALQLDDRGSYETS